MPVQFHLARGTLAGNGDDDLQDLEVLGVRQRVEVELDCDLFELEPRFELEPKLLHAFELVVWIQTPARTDLTVAFLWVTRIATPEIAGLRKVGGRQSGRNSRLGACAHAHARRQQPSRKQLRADQHCLARHGEVLHLGVMLRMSSARSATTLEIAS